jgi:hypothetical protein
VISQDPILRLVLKRKTSGNRGTRNHNVPAKTVRFWTHVGKSCKIRAGVRPSARKLSQFREPSGTACVPALKTMAKRKHISENRIKEQNKNVEAGFAMSASALQRSAVLS